MIEYAPASEPQVIAKKVIDEFHTHLHGVDIVYLWMNKTDKNGQPVIPKRKCKEVWGEVKLISGLNAYLSSHRTENGEGEITPYFVILTTQMVWNDRLTPEQREAYIDAMLCRCGYDDEKDTLTLNDYDIKEYHEIAKRRGAWNQDVETFLKVAKQLPLPNVPPPGRVKRARAQTAHTG